MSDPIRPLVAISAAQTAAVAGLTLSVLVTGVLNGHTLGPLLGGVVVYLIFLAGLAGITVGLHRRSRFARSPFVVAQLFGLVPAWLFLTTGQQPTVAVGVLLGALCLAGLVLALRPATIAALE